MDGMHQIFVWTREHLMDEVLAFALRRLGYACSIVQGDAPAPVLAPSPGPLVLVAGPLVLPHEARAAATGLGDPATVRLVFLIDDRSSLRPDDVPPTAVVHALPFDLQAFNQSIARLLRTNSRSPLSLA